MTDITFTDPGGSTVARLTTDHSASSRNKHVMVYDGEPYDIKDDIDPEVRLAVLRKAIDESGLSNRRFATAILMRNERTIRRWLAGDDVVLYVVYRELWRRLVAGDVTTAAP